MKGYQMSRRAKNEYWKVIYWRYRRASKVEKHQILDEFCRSCHYNRKYAIRKLKGPPPSAKPKPPANRRRGVTYSPQVIEVLRKVWEAAGYPWSVRLQALLPLWLDWIRLRYHLTPDQEAQLLAISPRQIDRRLQGIKRRLAKRIYGWTEPGTLLKHQIPIRTEHWDVKGPGWVEIDLVSHSGNSADGQFAYSLNLTDIYSGWVETIAVLGKGQRGVLAALETLVARLPFVLCGIDSDNGSEFINDHLMRYCRQHRLQFTRGRPYKKDDNAHIEQKNWTHVRKLLGWNRYDSPQAVRAINALYAKELRLMMNWFQPSVKLEKKRRVGSRLVRQYSAALTPLDRLPDSAALQILKEQRLKLNPFALAESIDRQLTAIWKLANLHHSPPSTGHKPKLNLGYLFK
ncbi:MAG: transposase [Planctomycetaceae bacterium]|nr:MAG: transposase [Planctomycetaceae bacterium]